MGTSCSVALGVTCLLSLATVGHADVRIRSDGSGRIGAVIEISSTINTGDAATFKQLVSHLRQTSKTKIAGGVPLIHVMLNSPGGNVMEAIEIGRVIRSNFIFTTAHKTQCASACVFILISGVSRVAFDARIGLHRPSFESKLFAKLMPDEARRKYDHMISLVQQYFTEMGGDAEAFRIMMQTPSDRIYVLSEPEIRRFGFDGTDPAWDEYVNASAIQQFGKERWLSIKKCLRDYVGDNPGDCM